MDPSPQHVVELPGACINSKVKWLLQVVLIFLCLQLATGNIEAICNDDEETDPQAPECLNDCRGRRFFLDVDELCKMCVQCQPGYEHDKECGNGANGDAICIECPEDHYSYNLYDCVACRVCENTLITQECSVSTDRQCGECLPGFYKDPQNPDLCNQRCEWLRNPDTIPACKAWLEEQQVTTLSTGMSLTSSFPGIIDEGTLRETTIIIIILVLVIVVIGGSVVPVYLCCKHYKYKSSKPKEVLLDIERGNCREHLDPGDAFPENGDEAGIDIRTMAHGTSEAANAPPLSTGLQQDGTGGDVTERVKATPMTQGTSEVATILPLANGPEQEDDCGSVENDGEDKNPDKPVMDVSDSTDGIDSLNVLSSMSNSLKEGGRDNGNSGFLDVSDERSESGDKVVHGVLENESRADKYDPSCNSYGEKFENNPLEISQDIHAPGTRNVAQNLRSTESTGISQEDDNKHIPRGSDSEGAQINEGGAGYDEEDGEQDSGQEEPDESQKLLSDAPLRSGDSTVISQVEDEHMRTSQDSEGAGICEGGAGDEQDGNKEEPDEHHRLLLNEQVEDHDKGAAGGKDGEWRGSAEEESSKPKKREKKDGPCTTNTLPLPSCNCNKSVTVHIGHVTNLVLQDQINNYNNGEHPPSP